MRFILISLFLFLFHALSEATYHSQCGQDKFVHETYFPECKNGVFVEIGAHDGMTFSNTYFFEKELGWKGICVEPLPDIFSQLQKNRSCICVQGCISNCTEERQFVKVSCSKPPSPSDHIEMLSGLKEKYDPRHLSRIERETAACSGSCELITVKCYLLNDILSKNGISHVNFLSIDTEGGEFDIISSIDFSRYRIDVIAVEDNYGDSRFEQFLNEKGYNLVNRMTGDLIFVHKDFTPK